MFNRRGVTNDDLGLPESILETDEFGKPISTYHKYYLKFTNTREEAF